MFVWPVCSFSSFSLTFHPIQVWSFIFVCAKLCVIWENTICLVILKTYIIIMIFICFALGKHLISCVSLRTLAQSLLVYIWIIWEMKSLDGVFDVASKMKEKRKKIFAWYALCFCLIPMADSIHNSHNKRAYTLTLMILFILYRMCWGWKTSTNIYSTYIQFTLHK